MIKKACLMIILAVIVMLAGSAIARPLKERPSALYLRWLDEDVVCIISTLK